MKKILFFAAGLIIFAGQIFAQNTDSTNVNTPDEQIIVNRQYDDQGNLIQYDSTYIHQWSSTGDSTIQFAFPDDGNFPDMEKMMREFMGDDMLMPDNSPFDNDFFRHFKDMMPDSATTKQFFARSDTAYHNYPHDSLRNYPQGMMPDMQELIQEMQKHFNKFPDDFGNMIPQFQSEEQEKEWEELMQKHQKEVEEFRKRWDK